MNYGLIALLARVLPEAGAFQIERASKKIERLSRSHTMLCERICSVDDPSAPADLAAIEAKIVAASEPWNLIATFEHDPRGYTVILSGKPGDIGL